MVSEEREVLDWDEDENCYLIEDASMYFSISKVEKSLREQDFRESSSEDALFCLSSRNVEAEYLDDEDYLKVDFNGHDLSDMKEVEMYHSLHVGHTNYADSLEFLYYKEIEDNMVPY